MAPTTHQATLVLVVPAGAATIDALSQPVAFQIVVEGQSRARLEVSKASDFATLVATRDLNGSGTLTADVGVLDAGDYFWRATTTSADGSSVTSSSRSFRIGRLPFGPATFALHVASSCGQFDRKDYAFGGTVVATSDGARFDAAVDASGVDFFATFTRSASGPTASIGGHAHQQFGLSSEHVYVQASQASTAAVTAKPTVDVFGAVSGSFSGFVRMILGTVSAGGGTCTAPDHSFSLASAQ